MNTVPFYTFLFLIGMFFLVGFVSLAKADTSVAPLEIKNAAAFATATSQKNGAAFMMIHNTSDEAIKIVSAESDVSETVELHTHIMDGDVMMMREVESFDIPANEAITLKPMGKHVMFMGLKEPLSVGESFPLVLVTDTGARSSVNVEIVSPGTLPAGQEKHDHKHHKHDH